MARSVGALIDRRNDAQADVREAERSMKRAARRLHHARTVLRQREREMRENDIPASVEEARR